MIEFPFRALAGGALIGLASAMFVFGVGLVIAPARHSRRCSPAASPLVFVGSMIAAMATFAWKEGP